LPMWVLCDAYIVSVWDWDWGKGSKVKGIIESRLTFFFSHTEGVNVYVPGESRVSSAGVKATCLGTAMKQALPPNKLRPACRNTL